MAARSAGWNEAQRYLAMRACGCPDTEAEAGGGRPSVSHPRNSQWSFEQLMALAESCAAARGTPIAPPAHKNSWRDAAGAETDRAIALAEAISGEASRRLPLAFPDASGLIAGLVKRITNADLATPDGRAVFLAVEHGEIRACTPDQVRRVVEALRDWVGRVFAEHGIEPDTFTIPHRARKRAMRRQSSSPGGTGLRPVSSPPRVEADALPPF